MELRPAPVPTLDPADAYLETRWNQAVYSMAKQRGLTQLPAAAAAAQPTGFQLAGLQD